MSHQIIISKQEYDEFIALKEEINSHRQPIFLSGDRSYTYVGTTRVIECDDLIIRLNKQIEFLRDSLGIIENDMSDKRSEIESIKRMSIRKFLKFRRS